MPLTPFQRDILRKKSLGASDMSAVLGINPYKSAYDVYLEKTGKLIDKEIEGGAVEAGNRFERAVLAYAQKELGPLRRNIYVVADRLPIHAILDAKVVESGEVVEAKTAGLFGPLSKEWGPEGSDEIPDAYTIQVQVQMLCTKTEIAHLAAFLAGRGFEMFHIERNPQLIDVIAERADEFWTKHVLADEPPIDSLPSLDVAKMIRRVPAKLAPVPAEVLRLWLQARDGVKQAEQHEENLKAQLLAYLGDAEASQPTDIGQLTYFEQGKPGSKIDEKRLKAEQPEVYNRFLKPGANDLIRVMRSKGKK